MISVRGLSEGLRIIQIDSKTTVECKFEGMRSFESVIEDYSYEIADDGIEVDIDTFMLFGFLYKMQDDPNLEISMEFTIDLKDNLIYLYGEEIFSYDEERK